MSIFNGLFGKGSSNSEQQTTVAQPTQTSTPAPTTRTGNEVTLDLSKGGLLNLSKGDFLNLTKSGVSLSRIRAAAGWDMASFGSIDLDLCAYLFAGGEYTGSGSSVAYKNGRLDGIVFYGDKRHPGIALDGDNLTGEGDGDDENITINFDKLRSDVDRIVIAVVIFSAGKTFGGVKNAYVRLVDESNGSRELVRYNLSEDGGRNKAVVAAELQRINGEWTFVAVGEYSNSDIKGRNGLDKKL